MNVRSRAVTLGLALLVVGVCALALTPSPLRVVVVLPAIVGVAGWSAARLVLGPRRHGDDGTLRGTLPLVLGVVLLLGAVLLAAMLGWRIDTPSIVAAAGFVALALLVAARWRTLVPPRAVRTVQLRGARRSGRTPLATAARAVGRTLLPSGAGVSARTLLPFGAGGSAGDGGPGPMPRPDAAAWRAVLRSAVGVAAAVVVLGGAVAGAIALRPAPVERYDQIAMDSAVAVSGDPVAARPGEVVRLGWSLSGYGGPLAPADPPVIVTVGGVPARDLVVDLQPTSPAEAATGAVDVQPGSVAFRAPATEGLYSVRITVDRSELVATLKVAR